MPIKRYEVAISDNGQVAKCKMVDEEEYKKLQKESEQALALERAKKEEMLSAIADLQRKFELLEQEIKVLKGED